MKKSPSVSPANGLAETVALSSLAETRKMPTVLKTSRSGQKLGVSASEDSFETLLTAEVQPTFAPPVEAVAIGSETSSSLPGLSDAAPDSFTMLAQAPAATSVSASSNASAAGFMGGASATTIGAIAAGVVVVGAAAASGGGGSDPKVIAVPTVATSTGGALAVTIGSDASTAKLYAGTTEITSRFTSAKVGSVVTFTPVAGQVEYTAQAITAKAVDGAGALSADSASVSYTFDNVAPAAAPTAVAGAAGAIAVTIGADATTAKLFAGSTDISTKFTSSKVGSVVTFTPVAGQVEFAATAITAKAVDASGNQSPVSTAITYTFDNVAPAAAPTATANTTTGAIAVTIGSDATAAKLFLGTTDISAKFTAVKAGSVVTFTPVSGQVEYAAQAITAKAADASGNLSPASVALTYSYDNVAPAAAPTAVANASTGAIAVTIGSDATTAKLFDGTTDIGFAFTSTKVGSVVTFTPNPETVEVVNLAVTARAADAAGNLSVGSSVLSYSFDNIAPAAAPTVVANATTGTVAVTIGSDATTAALYAGSTDISAKFTSAKVGSVVTFTPVLGQIEYAAQALIAKAADASGNFSPASASVSYSFDNVAPPAPTSVVGSPTDGIVTVNFGTSNGQVASTVKLFAGTTDITAKYVANTSVAGVVTYTPIAGLVELTAQTLKATVADAAGNASASATATAVYTFDNAIDITSSNVSSIAYSAAGANYAYTVNEGTYVLSIAGFGVGDQIAFKGTSAPSVSIDNASGSDGVIAIAASYGSNIIDVNLTGVAPAADTQVLGVASFNTAFGAGSLTGSSTAPTGPSTAVTIASTNSSTLFDASGSNVAYTVSEGTYGATIIGFSVGDSISFSGVAAASLSVDNLNGSDGSVVITGNFGSNLVDLTLNGLSATQDSAIRGPSTFNNLFGAGSLGSVTATPAGTAVAVSSSNAVAGFNASAANFAYSIAEGTYKTTVTGFGPGDSLSFFGSNTASLSVDNSSGSDGIVLVTGVLNGQAVDVTLAGLSSALDRQVIGVSSFNTAFGAGSIIA